MAERITIDLPDPEHRRTLGGLRHLTGYEIHDRPGGGYPSVEFEGMRVRLPELERLALSLLWMVRGHPGGDGLACEVRTTRPAVPGGGHA